MSFALALDIEEELAAAARGECGACRIGGTHKPNGACSTTPDRDRWQFRLCPTCGEQFAGAYFTGCPICRDPGEVRR